MDAERLVVEGAEAPRQRRVVEAEVRLPSWEEIKLKEVHLPKVDLEPVRAVAEDLLLVGIGVGVLVARGLMAAVRAAHDAGEKAAERPGPVTSTLMGLVRRPQQAPRRAETRPLRVPVLPFDNYDTLAAGEILTRVRSLPMEQVRTVRDYEFGHQARAELLGALDQLLRPDPQVTSA